VAADFMASLIFFWHHLMNVDKNNKKMK